MDIKALTLASISFNSGHVQILEIYLAEIGHCSQKL